MWEIQLNRLILVLFFAFGFLFAKEYEVDKAHSEVGFKLKHLSVSTVRGNFNSFNGVVNVENNKLLDLSGEIDTQSINTNNATRDSYIKEVEYFDVKKYPKATMKLISIDGNSGIFELNLKGVTKQIMLDVEVFGTSKNPANKEVVGLSLNGKINRKDFNIAKSTPNASISDQINIEINIEGVIVEKL